MNTHIKTWLGTVIIIIMAITAGMFIWKVYEISKAPVSAPQTFQTPKSKVKENNVGIANPASVFCEQNGGKLEIVTATDGSQSGMCKFSDGSQCEEWAFQRGECKIGDSQKQLDTSDWQIYKNEEYGFEFKYPKDYTIHEEAGLNFKVVVQYGKYQNNLPEGGRSLFISVRNINVDDFIKEYNNLDPGISKIIKMEDITISGVSGTKLIGTTAIGINSTNIVIQEKRKTFIIDYMNGDSIHNEILSTFKFIN